MIILAREGGERGRDATQPKPLMTAGITVFLTIEDDRRSDVGPHPGDQPELNE